MGRGTEARLTVPAYHGFVRFARGLRSRTLYMQKSLPKSDFCFGGCVVYRLASVSDQCLGVIGLLLREEWFRNFVMQKNSFIILLSILLQVLFFTLWDEPFF